MTGDRVNCCSHRVYYVTGLKRSARLLRLYIDGMCKLAVRMQANDVHR